MPTEFSPKTRQYDDDESSDYIDIRQGWFSETKDRILSREKRPKRELDQDRMDATFTNFSNVILPKKRAAEIPSKYSFFSLRESYQIWCNSEISTWFFQGLLVILE